MTDSNVDPNSGDGQVSNGIHHDLVAGLGQHPGGKRRPTVMAK